MCEYALSYMIGARTLPLLLVALSALALASIAFLGHWIVPTHLTSNAAGVNAGADDVAQAVDKKKGQILLSTFQRNASFDWRVKWCKIGASSFLSFSLFHFNNPNAQTLGMCCFNLSWLLSKN